MRHRNILVVLVIYILSVEYSNTEDKTIKTSDLRGANQNEVHHGFNLIRLELKSK